MCTDVFDRQDLAHVCFEVVDALAGVVGTEVSWMVSIATRALGT